jgi:hypothetical protein
MQTALASLALSPKTSKLALKLREIVQMFLVKLAYSRLAMLTDGRFCCNFAESVGTSFISIERRHVTCLSQRRFATHADRGSDGKLGQTTDTRGRHLDDTGVIAS